MYIFEPYDSSRAIPLEEYLLLDNEDKRDFFVSNTIQLKSAIASVVFRDLYRSHGKYTFSKKEVMQVEMPIILGIGIRETLILSN